MPLNPDASHDERGFPATMWTVLLTARDPVGPEARAAREAVCAAYWRPICAYLSALGLSKEDAEDATQTLLADFTNGGAIGRVDPAKGRLRHFLKAAARHALYNHRRAAKAVRRGGGQADLSLGSSAMSAMNDSLCPKCRTPQPLGNIGGMCPGCLALGGELDWLSAPQPVATDTEPDISGWRITGTLGAGGMGCVFLAEKADCGGPAAIKVLDARWARDPLMAARFENEADVFSLGVLLYHLLAGRMPLGKFTPLPQLTGLPGALDGIVARALEADPDKRTASASALRGAFETTWSEHISGKLRARKIRRAALEFHAPGRGTGQHL